METKQEAKKKIAEALEIPDEVLGIKLTESDKEQLSWGGWSELKHGIHTPDGSVRDGKFKMVRNQKGELEFNFNFKKEALIIPEKIGNKKLSTEQIEELTHGKTVLINYENKELYLKVDTELNSVTISSGREIGIPDELGEYILSEKDKENLANNKPLGTKLFKGKDGYFLANVRISQDRKEIIFVDIKTVEKAADVALYKEKFNTHPAISPVDNILSVVEPGLSIKTESVVTKESDRAVETPTNGIISFQEENKSSIIQNELNNPGRFAYPPLADNDIRTSFLDSWEKRDFAKIREFSEKGFAPGKEYLENISNESKVSIEDRIALFTIMGKELKENAIIPGVLTESQLNQVTSKSNEIIGVDGNEVTNSVKSNTFEMPENFYRAIIENNILEVQTFLKSNPLLANFQYTYYSGVSKSALSISLSEGNSEIAILLINNGAKESKPNIIDICLEFDYPSNIELVSKIVASDPNIQYTFKNFVDAIINKRTVGLNDTAHQIFKILDNGLKDGLKMDAYPNAKIERVNYYFDMPKDLETAVLNNNIEEVKNILSSSPELINSQKHIYNEQEVKEYYDPEDRYTDNNPKYDHSVSLVQLANENGSIEIRDYLVKNGADLTPYFTFTQNEYSHGYSNAHVPGFEISQSQELQSATTENIVSNYEVEKDPIDALQEYFDNKSDDHIYEMNRRMAGADQSQADLSNEFVKAVDDKTIDKLLELTSKGFFPNESVLNHLASSEKFTEQEKKTVFSSLVLPDESKKSDLKSDVKVGTMTEEQMKEKAATKDKGEQAKRPGEGLKKAERIITHMFDGM